MHHGDSWCISSSAKGTDHSYIQLWQSTQSFIHQLGNLKLNHCAWPFLTSFSARLSPVVISGRSLVRPLEHGHNCTLAFKVNMCENIIYIYVCDNRQGSEVPHGNVVPLMVFLGSSGLFHRVLKMVQQWSRKAEWRDAELSQTHPFSVNHENDETYRNENKWRPFSFIQLLSSSPNLSCQNCHSTSHNRHNRHNPRNQASTKIWYVPGQSPKDWIWHGSHSPSRGPGLTTHGEAMMSHHSLEIWETHT